MEATILLLVGLALALGYFGFHSLNGKLSDIEDDVRNIAANLPDKD